MALRLPSPSFACDYVLEEDRGSQQPTTFVLRRLTWQEATELQKHSPYTVVQGIELAAIRNRCEAEGREMTPEERARHDEIVGEPTAEKLAAVNEQLAAAARMGIVKILGLVDERGEPAEVSPEVFVRHARVDWVAELGREVLRISDISGSERKN